MLNKILKYGYSRIPVYLNKDKHLIMGYLLIKTLVGVDLSQGKTVKELISDSIVTLRKPLYVSPNEDIGGLLTRFKNGKSHMAIVTDNVKVMHENLKKYQDDDGSFIEEDKPQPEVKAKVLGIITLEDVIEAVLKEEILDEADYDIENDANFTPIMDKSFGAASNADTSKIDTIHNIIKKKVEGVLRRKGSDIGGTSSTLNKQWFELNDMSSAKEGLLDGQDKNNANLSKQDILRRQIRDPEMSKSYSFARNQKQI